MNITINDNNISSTLEINPTISPAMVFVRLTFQNGKLSILRQYAFENLSTSLNYEIEDSGLTLNFNFNEYNNPDSIIITDNLGTTYTLSTSNPSANVDLSVSSLSITMYRSLGLPIIFKDREGTIINSSYFNGSITLSVNGNYIDSSSGLHIDYSEYKIEERDILKGFTNELTGIYYVDSNTFNSNQGLVITPHFEIEYMKIIFYKSSAEKKILNKIPYLQQYFECEGELKEGTSIINPSILIDFAYGEHNEIFKSNYAYIPLFNRYYYIEDVTSIYTNLYEVKMKVDVLTSFKNEIYLQQGIIRRNEFTFNPDLIDEKMIQQIDYDIEITEYDNTLFNDTYYQECPSFVIMLSGKGTN